jgi:hypothetical protein
VRAALGCSSQEIRVTNDIDGPGFEADIKPMFR